MPPPRQNGRDDAEQRMVPRGLWLIAILEALSLAVLLTNLATTDNGGVAQAIGPVHGLFYLSGIALVWSNRLSPLSKVLVLLPAVGTLLAARHHTRSRNLPRAP